MKSRVNLRSVLLLKCVKHRTYNPEKNGPGAIRGGCERCTALYMIYNTQRKLINALRDFEQVSKPYETIKPRAPKKPVGTNPALDRAFDVLLSKVKPDLVRGCGTWKDTLREEKKVETGYQDSDFAILADFILQGNKK